MKKLILILAIVILGMTAKGQELDSIQKVKADSIQQAMYMKNIAVTVDKLMLAFGTIEASADTLQPMLYRGNDGEYYLFLFNLYFPLEAGRFQLNIPVQNRAVLDAIYNTRGKITIEKNNGQENTRIDGVKMPNVPIGVK